jgi:hypothetical protein
MTLIMLSDDRQHSITAMVANDVTNPASSPQEWAAFVAEVEGYYHNPEALPPEAEQPEISGGGCLQGATPIGTPKASFH